jgi:AmmeMemoRadiSam system protein A
MCAIPATPRATSVGYGSYAFEYSGAARTPESFRKPLLDVARQTIRHGIATGRRAEVDIAGFAHPLRTHRRSFVSVHSGGQLRGCVGSLAPSNPLIADVVLNAFRAAFEDKRFKPLGENDLAETEVGISVLSTPREMSFRNEDDLVAQIQPDTDGLILQDGKARGIFLPVVWEQISEPRTFLNHLKQKAGLRPDHWSDTVKVWRYTTESFGAKLAPADKAGELN